MKSNNLVTGARRFETGAIIASVNTKVSWRGAKTNFFVLAVGRGGKGWIFISSCSFINVFIPATGERLYNLSAMREVLRCRMKYLAAVPTGSKVMEVSKNKAMEE